MEVDLSKLMEGHSWKMSEKEIHDDLVELGYITDEINDKKMYDEIHKEILQEGDIVNINGRLYILEDE